MTGSAVTTMFIASIAAKKTMRIPAIAQPTSRRVMPSGMDCGG